MLIESAVIVGSLYAGIKGYRNQNGKKTKLGSALVKKLESPQNREPLPIVQQLTNFQSEQIDPLLDALYAKGERFVQNRIALQNATAQISLANSLEHQPAPIAPAERAINRNLTEAAVALTVNTFAAIVYPPLMLLTMPIMLKRLISIVQQAYVEVTQERKVGVATMIAIGTTSVFFLGKFWIFAFFDVLYMCSEKFLFLTRDRSQRDLTNLWGEMPRVAWCQRDGVEVEVALDQLQAGDRVIIHAGEVIPVDGAIVSGSATVDEHTLTGEVQPAEKSIESKVYAGTIALSGEIIVSVEEAGVETVTGQIAKVLQQTADYRSTVELRGEKIANASVLPTLALGAMTWGLLGPASATALLSCFIGFQLRYTSPLSILNFLQIATKEGVLVKDGRALELVSQVDTIVFDKTGTLTLEQLTVGSVYACPTFTEADVLRYAAAAEHKQTHPIARAILQEAQTSQMEIPAIADAAYTTGFGLAVTVQAEPACAQQVHVGSERYMQQQEIPIPAVVQTIQSECHSEGHSLVYVALDHQLMGVIELQPTIRPEAQEVVAALKARQLELYIISGDQAAPTQNLADKLGIEYYFAQVLPEEKATLVKQLQQAGKSVCFIGDGINDSIALKQADVSISLRGATTMAMDTAQIILMDGSLRQLPKLFALADRLESNMHRNLLAGTVPGIICLGGVFFLNFGIFTACLLAWTGLASGITNAMLPLMNYKQEPS